MAKATPTAPNIIFILSDQLRRQALGCYGSRDGATPHIDRLAADGVRFANACSTYPICVPYRFTLMTGEYAHSRRVPGIEWAMSPRERTLADEFNEAGYDTVYIGKWHLDGGHGRLGNAVQCNRMPVKRENQGRWKKWYGFELRNGPFDTAYFEDDDPTPRMIDGYQTDGLFDLGMTWLRDERKASTSADKPVCMVISVEPPHDPFEAPSDLEHKWRNAELDLPPSFAPRDEAHRERLLRDRRNYHAMVENLDRNVGRLRAFLAAEGLAENTILVFTGDHGELGGCHGLAGKQWPYEESVGVPLIIHDPRQPALRGSVVADPICTEDLFPTLLGLAGLPPRPDLHGADLAPLVRGEQSALPRDGVLLEFVAELRPKMPFHDKMWRSYRTARYKYTVLGNNLGSEPWQFFDLETDPCELDNRLDDPACQALIASLHRRLRDRMAATGDHYLLSPAHGVEGLNDWTRTEA